MQTRGHRFDLPVVNRLVRRPVPKGTYSGLVGLRQGTGIVQESRQAPVTLVGP